MNSWRLLAGFAALIALTSPAASSAAEASERGASIPWTSYEAEDANTSGTVLGPDYTGNTAQREASGRRCVRLAATGQYVEFTANADAQGLVVRYSIPDTADGRGADSTLTLYINGKLQKKLPMTSKFSYLYGGYP